MSRHFKKTLANGLRLVCIPQPHLHACEISCYVGVGSRHETDKTAGISHFLEHMLFRGAGAFDSSLELEKAFEALGGSANAATDAESTCYFSRLHPDRMAEGLALFASMLQRPLLKEIEVERAIIIEEAQEDFNEKGEEINPDTLMTRLLWPESPLARPTIGTLETLRQIDETMLREHLARYYTPGNCVIAVSGKVEPTAFFTAAESLFGDWHGAPPPATDPVGQLPDSPRATWVNDSTSQLTVQMAYPLPGRDSEHALGLRVLRRILSGGVASRLMLRLRETLGLTYNIEANLSMLAETGALVIDFMVVPENLVAAIDEVTAIIVSLCREPVPAEEFARVVSNYQYDLDFSNDHPDEMAARYGWGELVNFVRDVEADRRALEALDRNALDETISACLDPAGVKLVVVGPFRKADRQLVEARLETFVASFS